MFIRILLIQIVWSIFFSFGFSQSDGEMMKMWNSEVEKVGNRMVNEIDAELSTYSIITKIVTSKNYKNGSIIFYKDGSSLIKVAKSYSIDSIQYIENYYYRGEWPIYVDRKRNTLKSSDKFYFDKINLMLWISENNKRQNSGKKYKENWDILLENMDKFSVISTIDSDTINEDIIKLAE